MDMNITVSEYRGKCALRLLLALVVLTLLSGCASIPERDIEVQRAWLLNTPQSYAPAEAWPSEYIEKANAEPDAHGAVLLETGDDALLARLHLIGAAESRIDIQTFIWRDDPLTRALFNQLEQAARRGVRVRILIDALNRVGDASAIAAMAGSHRNIEIAFHRPLSANVNISRLNWMENLILRIRRLNRRMHNKIFIVDGLVGVVGGRNYEDCYYDRDAEMIFKDREVLVTGPSVRDMENMFETYWNHRDSVFAAQFKDVSQARNDARSEFSGEKSELLELLSLAAAADLESVRPRLEWVAVENAVFAWDMPDKRNDGAGDGHLELGMVIYDMMLAAEREILIQTPYLIYQSKTAREFKLLRKERPELLIKVSSNSLASADHLSVYAISFKHRQKFYKSLGLDICEFMPYPVERADMAFLAHLEQHPRMAIHAKSLVVDGKVAKVGSHNFDPRSDHFNSECGLIVVDADFAQKVRASILRDMGPGNSWMVGRKQEKDNWFDRGNRLVGDLSNMIPFFDIWPYRYTSNFALKEGMDPLPDSRHPGFYQCYADVGQFPEVDSLREVFRTHFYKIFVGWARPFM
jgi:cardiolipin synthase C